MDRAKRRGHVGDFCSVDRAKRKGHVGDFCSVDRLIQVLAQAPEAELQFEVGAIEVQRSRAALAVAVWRGLRGRGRDLSGSHGCGCRRRCSREGCCLGGCRQRCHYRRRRGSRWRLVHEVHGSFNSRANKGQVWSWQGRLAVNQERSRAASALAVVSSMERGLDAQSLSEISYGRDSL